MVFVNVVESVEQLQNEVSGSVITPSDPSYEKTRRGWNLLVNHHPAVILAANDAQDVVAGVRFANATGLGVSVQLTGHGIQKPADDSLLIVTSQMNSVEIDPQARVARVGSGVVWEQVINKVVEFGLAPLLGSTPHVGVVGYTLGGGIGWLARRYGLAADSVNWIEVVTPDGVMRRASATENSDLFWGLRGGGGNFGVVTALEFKLYPVATVYGGNLFYPAQLAGEALRFFREWVKQAPNELTSSIALMKYPNMPQLPDVVRGKSMVIVRAAYTGDPAKGMDYIQAWLDWHKPDVNTFREMPFAEIGTISNDPVDPLPSFGSHEMFNTLSDEAIEVIVRYATNSQSPLIFNEIRHAGGAIAQTDADANAVSNRDATFFFQMGGVAPTPEAQTGIAAYIQQNKHDLRPYVRGTIYPNFMRGSELAPRIKDAYSAQTYERLLALKAKYDPQNLFHYSYQLVAPKDN